MNTNRFYQVLIIILVLLNLGTLAFLWFDRPRPGKVPGSGHAAEFLIHELNMTPMQQDEFGRLRAWHHKRLLILQERDRRLHDRFFDALFIPVPDTLTQKILADSIASIRRQMELLTLEHFMQLKQLLTLEQKVKFHRVFRQAIERVMPLPPPQAPPPPPPAPAQDVPSPPPPPPPTHSSIHRK